MFSSSDYNVVALLRTVDAVKAAVGNNSIHSSPSRTVNDGLNVEPEQPFFYLQSPAKAAAVQFV